MQILTGSITLTDGILARRDELNTEHLLKRVDPGYHAGVFVGEHDMWYAEPEFAGQYVDACIQMFRRHGDPTYIERAKVVVDSMQANQRRDGYLGTYRRGLEFDETFSVWNQAFAVKALLSFFEATGSPSALRAATRCVDFIAETYLAPGGPDILKSVNQGLQHTAILQQVVRLYRITSKELYLEFARFIVRRWEESTVKFVTAFNDYRFPLFEIGALKAIESLICVQGIVELYEVTEDPRLLSAALRYWEVVRAEQINIIGCGALTELWVYNGNRPANLPLDVRPNETCVAWGWARLSMMLYRLTGDGKYIDAIEQTLYNHLLGAQATDGSDFSYYQGLIGRKVHAKTPGQYSCCRYRGVLFLANVADYVFAEDEARVYVNIFTGSRAALYDGAVEATMETEFPRRGDVRLTLDLRHERTFELCVRKPSWSSSVDVTVDGSAARVRDEKGYATVSKIWSRGSHTVDIRIAMDVRVHEAQVDHRSSCSITYGPLVLAIDSRYGTPIHATSLDVSDGLLHLIPAFDRIGGPEPLVRFTADGEISGQRRPVTLVDYAGAGSLSPNEDWFKVWIPVTHENSFDD